MNPNGIPMNLTHDELQKIRAVIHLRPTFQPIVEKIDMMLQPPISSKEVFNYIALLSENEPNKSLENIKRFVQFLIDRDKPC